MIKNLDDLLTPEMEVPSTYAEYLLLRTQPSLRNRLFGDRKIQRPERGSTDSYNLWVFLNMLAVLGDEPYIALGGKQRTYVLESDHQVSPAIYEVHRRKFTSLHGLPIHPSNVGTLTLDPETKYVPVKNNSSPLFYSVRIPRVVEDNWDLIPTVTGSHRKDQNARILAASLVRTLAQSKILKEGLYSIKGDYAQISPEGFSVELNELRKGERRTA